jgi:hypothetical protein
VHHAFGQGQAIYSATDIERLNAEAPDHLFRYLLRSLLDGPPTLEVETHPAVWAVAYRQSDCLILGFLNYQMQFPALPIPRLSFRLRLPPGKRVTTLLDLPAQTAVPYTESADGVIDVKLHSLDIFRMLKVCLAERS